MVEARLSLEPEVQQIFQLIDNGKNFLLSGGAGSGKTFSLVSVIRQVTAENPTTKVACMTYTNAAAKEIEERVNHKNLNVSTIHDFLWDNIKHFQKELKEAVISLANNKDVSSLSIDVGTPIPESYFDTLSDGIQYKGFVRLREGIISHDELLLVANYIFEKYPKLSSIVKDKYKFIFIDEYQDTSKVVVEIFLTHFKKSEKKSIIGFFGDAMQSIYDDGIGNLSEFVGSDSDTVIEIPKKQNRRNPHRIIDLANKLRTDSIIQEPSNDPDAPNMCNGAIKHGCVLFLHSIDNDEDTAKKYLTQNYGWDFNDTKETKELNLTHNLIASKAGFRTLMDIYDKDPVIGLKNDILKRIKDSRKKKQPQIEIVDDESFDSVVDKFEIKNKQKQLKKDVLLADQEMAKLYAQLRNRPFSEVSKIYLDKDALIDDNEKKNKNSKRDNLVRHLFKIQNSIFFYQNKEYNEFLRVTDFRIQLKTTAHKKTLRENIESLVSVGDKTIEQIILEADERGICLRDDKLVEFIDKNAYLYNRVKNVKFSEFQKLYEYLEKRTPFSTQHKTKGAQFDNVLVILNNGDWNNYNFEKMLLGTGIQSVSERTRKIFYVCCTRAKENLAIYFHKPKPEIIVKAEEWFGSDSVVDIG